MLIILISCAAEKSDVATEARNMYISSLFKGAYQYARNMNPDKIFILSAKHELLEETKVIEPYNKTLNKMPSAEIKSWANAVITKLAEKTDLENDKFIILAGEKYRKYIVGSIHNYEVPLKGKSIGKQLAFYKEANNVRDL